jgi:hypothetical protein
MTTLPGFRERGSPPSPTLPHKGGGGLSRPDGPLRTVRSLVPERCATLPRGAPSPCKGEGWGGGLPRPLHEGAG